jgi:hypothetical protein
LAQFLAKRRWTSNGLTELRFGKPPSHMIHATPAITLKLVSRADRRRMPTVAATPRRWAARTAQISITAIRVRRTRRTCCDPNSAQRQFMPDSFHLDRAAAVRWTFPCPTANASCTSSGTTNSSPGTHRGDFRSSGQTCRSQRWPLPPHRSGRPWYLDVVVKFADETRAVAFEQYLKSGSECAFATRHLR